MANEGTGQKLQQTLGYPHQLTIFEDTGAKKYKVRPGKIEVKKDETLEWKALGTTAKITFPKVNGLDVVNPNPILPNAQGLYETRVVLNLGLGENKEIDYQVDCNPGGPAEGDSDPKIIVKGA